MCNNFFDCVPDMVFTPTSTVIMPSEDAYDFYLDTFDQYVVEYAHSPQNTTKVAELCNTLRFLYPYLAHKHRILINETSQAYFDARISPLLTHPPMPSDND